MTTSEPTTEIVDDLRFYLLVASKEKPTQLISTIARAADRLESQEQTIAELMPILYGMQEQTVQLTARAEQAERERDAAYGRAQEMASCDECKHLARTWNEEPCKGCCAENYGFERRGQPQDGEGL